MDTSNLRRPWWALVSALCLAFSGLAAAEPPSRAARLGDLSGTVSFAPAGQADWVQARINRPLTTGDGLWTGTGSRAEIQIAGTALRMGPSTSMSLLNLDDRITQIQLSQGSLSLRVRSMGRRQSLEVDTPNLAFTVRQPGEYRIEVDPGDDATTVMVRSGSAEAYGEGASYTLDTRRAYRFYGTDLSDYDIVASRHDDDLDRWAHERDRRLDNSVSARYVSSAVVGYEDLDANGSWRVDVNFGNVWTPHRVAAGWSPYRDGHWTWVDPWGWTWVDDAPWGYAVSHYGRWAHLDGSWAWVPGPRQEQAVYAPALVAFVDGRNFRASVSVGSTIAAAVGWFPLAPREIYRPTYPVSRDYFANVNRSNAVIAPTTITNVYNTTIVNNSTQITNVIYANQRVTGAVVAVPTQTFVQSLPVAKAIVSVSPAAVAAAPVVRVSGVAPVPQSVHGGAPEAVAKPPVREHAVVARTAPPPPPVPFVLQQRELAARPGAPIDDLQRRQLKPAAPPATAPRISVVTAVAAPTPTALPPATPPAAKSPAERRAGAARSNEADAAKADTAKADAAKADAGKAAEARAAQAAQGAQAASERDAASKAVAAKAAQIKADAAARDQAAQLDKAKADADKARVSKAEAQKAEADRAETSRDTKSKAAEAAKADATRAAAGKAAEAQAAQAAQAAAERDAASKAVAAKAAQIKADAAARDHEVQLDKAKADADKARVSKAEAQKAEADRAEASRDARAKAAEAAKADAARAAAGNSAAAQAASERDAASKAAAAKAAEVKADAAAQARAAQVDKARADAQRADLSKAEAQKAGAARADAARAAEAKAEAAKTEAAKAQASREAATRAAEANAKAKASRDTAALAAASAEKARGDQARAEQARADAGKAVPPAKPPRPHASEPKSGADEDPAADRNKRQDGRKP